MFPEVKKSIKLALTCSPDPLAGLPSYMIGFPGCVVDSSCQIHITDYEKAIQLLTVNAQFLYTENFLNKYNM